MKVTSLFLLFDEHDVFFANGSGVSIATVPGLVIRGDADVMERLAAAASKSARLQRDRLRLPGCDGSQMPATDPQARRPLLLVAPGDQWETRVSAWLRDGDRAATLDLRRAGQHASIGDAVEDLFGRDGFVPVVYGADLLSAHAANVLLGFLEAGRFCVLTTEDASRVLPTLRRYCRTYAGETAERAA